MENDAILVFDQVFFQFHEVARLGRPPLLRLTSVDVSGIFFSSEGDRLTIRTTMLEEEQAEMQQVLSKVAARVRARLAADLPSQSSLS